jgi:hypothetical protein
MVARAQQPPGKIKRLGVLHPGAPPDPLIEAMQGRLHELGYIERRTLPLNFGGRRESSSGLPNWQRNSPT